MGRAKDRKAIRLAAVYQLTKDEPRLDRLADPHVVGDQQPNEWKPKRHEQRHQLVRSRLEADTRGRPERPGAPPHGKLQRLRQKARGVLGRDPIERRRREASRTRRLEFKCGVEALNVRFGARQRTQAERFLVR